MSFLSRNFHKIILFIGVRSSISVQTGLSVMFESLLSGASSRGIPFFVVDLKNRSIGAIGSFGLLRALIVLRAILSCWIKTVLVRNTYLQLSLSRFGLIRDFFILWPAFIFRKNTSVHVHSGGYGVFYSNEPVLFQWIIRITLSRVDRIIVLSESLRNQFDFMPVLLSKTVVVPNGVASDDIEKVTPKIYIPGEPFRIIYLSNLIETKGYWDVLKACHLLLQAGIRDFRCDFCGEFITLAEEENSPSIGHGKQRFFECIEEWNLAGQVFYNRPVTGFKKKEFLRNAHVLVLPTKYLWEGQPVCILEALSLGIPVITTAFRAIPDQIEDNYNGIIVDYGAPDQIKDAIERLMSDEELFQHLSRNALTRYQEKFTIEKHLDHLLPLIIGNMPSSFKVS